VQVAQSPCIAHSPEAAKSNDESVDENHDGSHGPRSSVEAGGFAVTRSCWLSALTLTAALGEAASLWSAPQQPVNSQGREPTKIPQAYSPVKTPLPKPAEQLEQQPCVYQVDWAQLVDLTRTSGMEVRLAENRVREANAGVAVAQSAWLPNLRVGTSYLHHDGFIQDIPGNILNANKNAVFAGPLVRFNLDAATTVRESLKARQLARVRDAQLQREVRQHFHDAALAYVDLQSAQAGAAVYAEVMSLLGEIVNRAEKFREAGWISRLQVQPYEGERQQQRLGLLKIKQDHLAAGAKLADLLDVETPCVLYSSGDAATMLQLVDVSQSEASLVATAMAQGPGTTEVDFALQSLQEQLAAARKFRFVPQVGVDLGYGIFGGGVGDNYKSWGDRTDVGVHVYWDLSELLRADANRCLFETKKQQVHLQRQQVQKKLSLGVRVALLQARSAQERLTAAEQNIANALDQYLKVRDMKPVVSPNLRGEDNAGESERVLSVLTVESRFIAQLAAARTSYLEALIVWNKAQITLNFLTGACSEELAQPSSGERMLPPPTVPQSSNDKKGGASRPMSVPIEQVRGKAKAGRSRGPYPRLPVDDRSP
jgi:outer membrane protein TolC